VLRAVLLGGTSRWPLGLLRHKELCRCYRSNTVTKYFFFYYGFKTGKLYNLFFVMGCGTGTPLNGDVWM
jgi:hypothetical protein